MKKWLVCGMALFCFLLTSCSAFGGMSHLPEGEFVSAHDSPQGDYTVNIYLCGGGATVDYSIRGELVSHTDNIVKNIYWNYHESEAVVEWTADDVVEINGKKLQVPNEVYDFRQ